MGIVSQIRLVVTAAALVACSGNAFEQGSSGGSDLAGAAGDAGAGSIGTSGSSMLGGSSSSGGAGSSSGGSSASNEAGEGGDVVSGTAGSGGVPMLVQCSRSGWTASAFATYEDKYGGPAELVLDGDDATRWSGGLPAEPGQWFQVDVTPGVLALEVRSTMFPGDVPAKVGLMLDGKGAGTTQGKVAEGVLMLTAPGLELAKEIRLLVVDAGAAAPWWSIGELVGWCAR